jgi:hypothetical protein
MAVSIERRMVSSPLMAMAMILLNLTFWAVGSRQVAFSVLGAPPQASPSNTATASANRPEPDIAVCIVIASYVDIGVTERASTPGCLTVHCIGRELRWHCNESGGSGMSKLACTVALTALGWTGIAAAQSVPPAEPVPLTPVPEPEPSPYPPPAPPATPPFTRGGFILGFGLAAASPSRATRVPTISAASPGSSTWAA